LPTIDHRTNAVGTWPKPPTGGHGLAVLPTGSAAGPLLADPSGALFWPAEALVVVADLHLEKGSAMARLGLMLPPYDTRGTLARLERVLADLAPRRVISLGDGFHDPTAAGRLDAADRRRLGHLIAAHDWIWVTGNHDPEGPAGLPGRVEVVVEIGGLQFRHLPAAGSTVGERGEVAGHLHPRASVVVRGRRLSRRCFVGDRTRLVLPAFGAYAGGLDVFDPAIAGLFAGGFEAALLGAGRVHALPQRRLIRRQPARRARPAYPGD
jgi:DNA ligase-associated metallophosphoesterase